MQNAKCKMQNEETDTDSVGAVIGRPPEAEASDEASGIRDQASGDEPEMQNAKCKMQNEETDADSVEAGVPDGPPEDEASGIAEKAKKRIAGLESLRRIMLILAPLLLIGGYAADILPILYAAAIPLAIALVVTYRIKHLEEAAGREKVKSKK